VVTPELLLSEFIVKIYTDYERRYPAEDEHEQTYAMVCGSVTKSSCLHTEIHQGRHGHPGQDERTQETEHDFGRFHTRGFSRLRDYVYDYDVETPYGSLIQ
jgi:hypothetical protein